MIVRPCLFSRPMMTSLAANRITTFAAPPILELKRPAEEQKEHSDPAPQLPPTVLPPLSSQAPPTPINAVLSLPVPSSTPVAETKGAEVAEAAWATEAGEEEAAVAVAAPRKLGLSLRLSNAETVEDDNVAHIQVEGAESPAPAFGLKLKLSLASADDDSTPQIATSTNTQSATQPSPSVAAAHSDTSSSERLDLRGSIVHVLAVRSEDGAALENKWQLKIKEGQSSSQSVWVRRVTSCCPLPPQYSHLHLLSVLR